MANFPAAETADVLGDFSRFKDLNALLEYLQQATRDVHGHPFQASSIKGVCKCGWIHKDLQCACGFHSVREAAIEIAGEVELLIEGSSGDAEVHVRVVKTRKHLQT